MINLKSSAEIGMMRKSGLVLRDLLLYLEEKIRPGVSTKKLDEFAYDYIKRHGGTPSFLGYGGFPASICTSVDEAVVHGIPGHKRLEEGMIVGIDAGVILNGWQSDAARTFPVGEVSEEKRRLMDVTRESFFEGVKHFKEGGRLGDISEAIQEYNESRGYGVVRDLVGHGIGRKMHDVKLQRGLVLAIEPMVNMGTWKVITLDDEWTCVTADGKPSAHYENTVALTENGAEILTL